MTPEQLCEWLRQNSSGIYRPAAEAAAEIESLLAALADLKCQRGVLAGLLTEAAGVVSVIESESSDKEAELFGLRCKIASALNAIAAEQVAALTPTQGWLELEEYMEAMRQGPSPEEWAELDAKK